MAKSLIRRRREARATCSRCLSPDYRMEPPPDPGCKPVFVCGRCGATWCYGRDGGKYAALAGTDTGEEGEAE